MFCKRCETAKSPSEFYPYNPSRCKPCCQEVGRAWAHRNPERVKANNKAYREGSRSKVLKLHRDWYRRNKASVLKQMAANKVKVKKEVLAHYGGQCACCSENTYEFLTMDHMNNDGAAHRRADKLARWNIYRWLKQNGFPKDFQILCANCHLAKSFFGACPHKLAAVVR